MSSEEKSRLLVLCFDGTSNKYDTNNTNVVRFHSLLAKDQRSEQITYYQSGLGTYFNPGVVSPLLNWVARMLDEAIAWYLDHHVRDGYRFIMQNYQAGDKICIFGFSRGAYAAQALAGLLYKIGVLPRDNEEQIPFAYELYKRTDEEGIRLSAGFKKSFCCSVTIDFVGVWDTVTSVGTICSRKLPFTNSNIAIKFFRHAVSLDERRARFQPNLYHHSLPGGEGTSLDAAYAIPVPKSPRARNTQRKPKSDEHTPTSPLITQSLGPVSGPSKECNILEVWFAGCHGDVGGGSVPNDLTASLADISLRWMVRQVVLSCVGIRFKSDALARANMDISAILHGTHDHPSSSTVLSTSVNQTSMEGLASSTEGTNESEGGQTSADALAPLHDELKRNVLWWILEVLPMRYCWQTATCAWQYKWGCNLGKGRVIRTEHPKFHLTVKERMEDPTLKYSPAATWIKGQEKYVN